MQTTIRGRLTCFCRVCYVRWYGQRMWWMIYVMYEIDHVLVIGITTCMSMSMTTGRSHRSCLYFFVWPACHWETPCKLLYFIAKRVSHSSRSNSWRATSWRHDDGDHGVMPVTRWSWSPKMEIKGAIWYWPYHVTIFDCMWCLSFMHIILLWLTIAL